MRLVVVGKEHEREVFFIIELMIVRTSSIFPFEEIHLREKPAGRIVIDVR